MAGQLLPRHRQPEGAVRRSLHAGGLELLALGPLQQTNIPLVPLEEAGRRSAHVRAVQRVGHGADAQRESTHEMPRVEPDDQIAPGAEQLLETELGGAGHVAVPVGVEHRRLLLAGVLVAADEAVGYGLKRVEALEGSDDHREYSFPTDVATSLCERLTRRGTASSDIKTHTK